MKGYKAFNKGLVCRGKRYAENTVFEEENAEICKRGMHFCKNPLDVLDYYPLIDNEGNVTEFAEVEALDDVKTNDGKKFCTKRLKIGAKLSLWQFIKASFDVTYQNIKSQVEVSESARFAGDNNTKLIGGGYAKLVGSNYAELIGGGCAKLAGGMYAKLVGGDCATLAGGAWAKLTGGDDAKLIGGDCAKLIGEYSAKLVGGNGATLVGGLNATVAGGDCAKLVGDNYATLVGGNSAKLVGGNGATLAGGYDAIIVGDNGSVAKGKKGSIIVLVERDGHFNIVNFKAVQVDGEKIKEDVLYKLENGEFVEVE